MLNKELILQKKWDKHLSYKDISDRLGYNSPATVYKFLKGNHELKAKHIEALASMLDLTVEQMFTTGGDAI